MRPGQQNRRSRNRNNNRKGPNPLSRSFESNGPDVKIRGNAQHIADKYSQLARDAAASGDRVMAENYLQHAEHYYRIIAAAQAQLGIQQQREREDDDDGEIAEEAEELDGVQGGGQESADFSSGSGPQPVFAGTPAEVAIEETDLAGNDGNAGNRGDFDRRNRRNRNRRPMQAGEGSEGQEGEQREQRQFQPRQRNDRGDRPERQERAPRADAAGEDEGPQDGSAIGWLAVAGQD